MSAMMSLAQAAKAMSASFSGDGALMMSGVSTDTRSLKQGDLFIALEGPNFDAHTLLAQAREKGAVAAVVHRDIDDELLQLNVADTRLALGQLAAAWRQQFQGQLVAVTGSNGKTTVKEMLASIFAQSGQVLATSGNFNNDIGMPLTLLNLRPQHDYAVIEMGANHMGEIAYLTALAQPQVALVNNVGGAHIEGFGSLENIAKAKAEIWQGLVDGGVAVINIDDQFAPQWLAGLNHRPRLTFGNNGDVSLQANQGFCWRNERFANRFTLQTPEGMLDIDLPLAGEHNVKNAMAAAAVALAVGVGLNTIKHGLEIMLPVKGRLQAKSSRWGQLVLDDSYNANPASVKAAIHVLAAMAGEKILVLGDMGELGPEAAAMHHQVGCIATQEKIDRLFAVGELSRQCAAGFGEGAQWFATREALIQALNAYLSETSQAVTVLVKGSRGSAMDKVVDELVVPVAVKEGA